jgi:serine/threonine-protein kinase
MDEHQRYEEAIAQYNRAIQLAPDNAPVYLNLGGVYIDMGDPKHYADAERMLKKSIALEPSYQAFANLGYLYIQQQKYAEAADAVEKALQVSDRDYLVWGNLALAYEGLKNKGKADEAHSREIALLEQAAAETPRDAIVQSTLGLLYAKKKMREKAISRIQSALVLSPDDPNVLEAAGQAYELLGDRSQALQNIQKSLQKGYVLAALKNIPDLQGLLADPRFKPSGK